MAENPLATVMAAAPGLARGGAFVEVVRHHLGELESLLQALVPENLADGVIAGLMTSWHYNRAFDALIQSPRQEIVDAHVLELLETGSMPKSEAGPLAAYLFNSKVTPAGVYYHNFDLLSKADPRPYSRINLRELPPTVQETLREELHEWYTQFRGIYEERLCPMREKRPGKFHAGFIEKTAVELDGLRHVLAVLREPQILEESHEGKVTRFDDAEGDLWLSGLHVRAKGLSESQVMSNHRMMGQQLFPLQPRQKVRFFQNLAFDWTLEYEQGGEQGTLYEVLPN